MADLLKGVLLQKKDGSRSRAEEVLKDKVVALYFSGHYCLACRDFTPVLKSFYNELLSSEKFEVVFVSSDLTEEDQKKYMEECHGDWYCVPHGSTKCK
ncbi:unnamed protein product [Heligmosomoides polygyrus]|uniref:Thioredoxin-like_fold domain-containing protein n=1 Tax=Heligmosomoides polygyrus TaxID=6339 RepID=A0A183GCL8_HELPZ|nr:unnamed protein product [Heligmosomoides polygyrus]